MKIAIVGVTGMVGRVMLEVLEERNFPLTEIIPVASEKSVGKSIVFKGKEYTIRSVQEAVDLAPDIALFSAGAKTSLEWAPKFAQVGTVVVDNSSAWRMYDDVPLIVPEVNAHQLTNNDKIIANPNCSTIQLVMALASLHKEFKIKRLIVSTYQSITGTGIKALQQLENEYQGVSGIMAYKYQIHQNAIPQCDVFEDNGYTKEEMKLVRETQKILRDDTIQITATAVRIPVIGGHSESVNIEFENKFEIEQVYKILQQADGVVIQDNPDVFTYPMPLYAKGKDQVFVGRIRKDYSRDNSLNMWIVADNLRKGAATNTIQIAEYLIEKKIVKA